MGGITLPRIFQDGMVLQRRKPACIWGRADEGETITVRLAAARAQTAAKNGEWKVFLPPMEAESGLTLSVSSGADEIVIEDVAVGEVWLAGGQSNMEFLLRDDADAAEAAQTDNAQIRCFEVPKISYAGQENDRDYSAVGLWRKARKEESLYFTAVGFYFAKLLNGELDVPIGVINCTWGGTSASAFTAEKHLTGRLRFFLDEAEKAQSKLDQKTELEQFKAMQRMIDSFPIDNSVPNLAPIHPDKAMIDAMEEMNALHLSRYSPFRPCGLYETMLQTIVPYSVSGVIWYQGESDEPFGELYEELMHAMIVNWRDLWHEDLPFIMVQLASFEYMVEPLNFVPIRAIQENLTKTMNRVWLACAMDVGMQYDIHPKKKKPVGERLALQALSKVYGFPILADSPTLESCARDGAALCIRLKDCGDGLVCRGDRLETFDVEIGGAAANDLTIRLEYDTIRITSPELKTDKPISVAFCQHPFCEDNVYNSAGLPVLPFVCSIT